MGHRQTHNARLMDKSYVYCSTVACLSTIQGNFHVKLRHRHFFFFLFFFFLCGKHH